MGRLAKSAVFLSIVAAAAAAAACGPGEARAPNPTRPLDERRAVEVIRKAVALEGVKPAPGRDETLTGHDKVLRVDVGVEGYAYGIAYITSEDAEKLGSTIPPKPAEDEKGRIVRVGDAGDGRILLLYQDNYRYDDLVGEGHEQTAIAVERVLTRDVHDFINYAKEKKLK